MNSIELDDTIVLTDTPQPGEIWTFKRGRMIYLILEVHPKSKCITMLNTVTGSTSTTDVPWGNSKFRRIS